MALEIPLIKSNLVQKSILLMGPYIWNKLSNDLNNLNAATSFTHNYKKLVLKKLESVEHNSSHNFYYFCHYCNDIELHEQYDSLYDS